MKNTNNQKSINLKSSESGMVGIIFVMMLSVMSSLLVSQIILNQKKANAMHSDLKMGKDVQKKLFLLTLKLKEAQNRAAIGNGCDATGGTAAAGAGVKYELKCLNDGPQVDDSGRCVGATVSAENVGARNAGADFTDIVANGTGFCFPANSESLCEESEFKNADGSKVRFCTSIAEDSLKWKNNDYGSGNLNASAQAPASNSPAVVSNTIQIPAADATQKLWKSCSGAGSFCLRVLLCADNEIGCDPDEAVAYQIVKF
jgi:hypothetical protein